MAKKGMMGFFNFKKFKLDFIVIGVQKAGTSALDQYLRQHPQVEMAAKKELHFFDNDHLFKNKKVDFSVLKKYFKNFGRNKIYGESTPAYIYWDSAIHRIYKYNRKIKLIAILRNPVDRAFSQWNMEISRNLENRNFRQCIEEEIQQINKGIKVQHKVKSYVERGLYTKQIDELYKYFPNNQVMFIKYDDFIKNQQKVVNDMYGFLKISDKVQNTFTPIIRNKIKYTHRMQEDEREILLEFYKEEIIKLEKILGWDCGNWKV